MKIPTFKSISSQSLTSDSLLHEDPNDEQTPHLDQGPLVTWSSALALESVAFTLKGLLFPEDLFQVLEK